MKTFERGVSMMREWNLEWSDHYSMMRSWWEEEQRCLHLVGFLGKKMSGCVGITLLTKHKTIVDHTLPNSGCVGNGNCSAANRTKL